MFLNILFSIAGGLLTASWGAYKDSPYEDFSLLSFIRSILVTTAYYFLALALLDKSYIHNFVVLLSAIALERLTQEIWKAFFRKNQRSGIYKIPQSFHVFGQVIQYRNRFMVGSLLSILVIIVMVYLFNIQYSYSEWVLPALLLSIIPTFGGAWKDAPIEGFEITKFPRSFLVMFFSAFLINRYTNNLLMLILAAAGLERLLVEFYKTFIVRSTPGKFVGKVYKKHWLNSRKVFVSAYLLAIAMILLLWQ